MTVYRIKSKTRSWDGETIGILILDCAYPCVPGERRKRDNLPIPGALQGSSRIFHRATPEREGPGTPETLYRRGEGTGSRGCTRHHRGLRLHGPVPEAGCRVRRNSRFSLQSPPSPLHLQNPDLEAEGRHHHGQRKLPDRRTFPERGNHKRRCPSSFTEWKNRMSSGQASWRKRERWTRISWKRKSWG